MHKHKLHSVISLTNDNATPTGRRNSNKHKACNHNGIVWETSKGNCNVSDRHVEWDPQCKSYPHKRKENNVLICSALNLAAVLNLIMQSNVLEKTALQFSKPLHGIRQQLKICSSSIELNQGSFVAFGLFTCYLIYHLLIALRKVFVAPEEVRIFACISHKFTCFQFSAIDIDWSLLAGLVKDLTRIRPAIIRECSIS